jgi:hypothetical protein
MSISLNSMQRLPCIGLGQRIALRHLLSGDAKEIRIDFLRYCSVNENVR